jgi:hypothetical protein
MQDCARSKYALRSLRKTAASPPSQYADDPQQRLQDAGKYSEQLRQRLPVTDNVCEGDQDGRTHG